MSWSMVAGDDRTGNPIRAVTPQGAREYCFLRRRVELAYQTWIPLIFCGVLPFALSNAADVPAFAVCGSGWRTSWTF